MKSEYRNLGTEFDVASTSPTPFPRTQETELERLKDRLLQDLLARAEKAEHYAPLRRATSEAAALAWATPFPLLVLPELVREKAEEARRYTTRQAALRQRRRPRTG
jgi:hypothetical protein